MENFETDVYNSGYFDEITLAVLENSEETIRISEDYSIDEIDLSYDCLSSSELIANLSETFEKNIMNEHLATIDMLGNLGYTDMLMYYCMVMDCLFTNNELGNTESPIEIITPIQYVNEKVIFNDKVFEFVIEVSKISFAKLLNYFKNKEFKILSNTFYMDGSDFIILLKLKSSVGYNLRLKIVLKCDSLDEIVKIHDKFQEIQRKFTFNDE